MNFAYCQQCYSPNYLRNCNSDVAEEYEERYEIPWVVAPPEVQRSGRYNNLVDYYGIGVVLAEMFAESSSVQRGGRKERDGIEIAIENLMAGNTEERELFCKEIVAELQEEKVNRC
jgi:hypothetical protein